MSQITEKKLTLIYMEKKYLKFLYNFVKKVQTFDLSTRRVYHNTWDSVLKQRAYDLQVK